MLSQVFDEKILRKEGKAIVAVDDVIFPGLLFICDVLKQNGLVERGTLASDDSLCLACGKTKLQHDTFGTQKMTEDERKLQQDLSAMEANERLLFLKANPKKCTRRFYPIYYDLVHAYLLDKMKIIDDYNEPINMHGLRFKVLVATFVIGVSYTFLDTKNHFILTPPAIMTFQQQLEMRPVRTFSLAHMVEQIVRIHLLIMVFNDPSINSREQVTYIEKNHNYNKLLLLLDSLISKASDRELYGSTQSPEFVKSLPSKTITEANYYARHAGQYRIELANLIKQLYTEYNCLDKETIVRLIQKRDGLLTETNTSVFTRTDIIAALYLLLNNLTQADDCYFNNPVGIAVIHRNLFNIVVNKNGIVGSVVRLKDDVYMFKPHTKPGYGFRRSNFDYARNIGVFYKLFLADFAAIELEGITIQSIEATLAHYNEYHKLVNIKVFTKEQLVKVFRLAIINWSIISPNYKLFMQNFIKSREVFLRRHLHNINISGVPDDHPCGYLNNDVVFYYNPLALKKDTQDLTTKESGFHEVMFMKEQGPTPEENSGFGSWEKASSNVFTEVINKVGVFMYYNEKRAPTLFIPGVQKENDDRHKTTGVKCKTMKKEKLKIILGKFYEMQNQQYVNLTNTLSAKCENIEKTAVKYELSQWSDFLLFERKMLNSNHSMGEILDQFVFHRSAFLSNKPSRKS